MILDGRDGDDSALIYMCCTRYYFEVSYLSQACSNPLHSTMSTCVVRLPGVFLSAGLAELWLNDLARPWRCKDIS